MAPMVYGTALFSCGNDTTFGHGEFMKQVTPKFELGKDPQLGFGASPDSAAREFESSAACRTSAALPRSRQ
jgi:hypothetical protein